MILADIGKAIRAARKGKKISQEALAERMGVTTAAISRYENGTRQPTIETLESIAKGLGIHIVALLAPDADMFTEEELEAAAKGIKAAVRWDPKSAVASRGDALIAIGDEVFAEDSFNLQTALSDLNHRGMLALIEYAKVLSTMPGYVIGEDAQYLTPEKPEGGE